MDSPECQAFFDQGLAWLYSWEYADAVQSFETALFHDPDWALAWWSLRSSRHAWHEEDFLRCLRQRLRRNRAARISLELRPKLSTAKTTP
jgi:hypothetical protein